MSSWHGGEDLEPGVKIPNHCKGTTNTPAQRVSSLADSIHASKYHVPNAGYQITPRLWLKNDSKLLFLTVFASQELRSSYSGSSSESLMRFSRLQSRLWPSEGLTEAGGSTSEVARSLTLCLACVALSTCYLTECPHIVMAGLPPETLSIFMTKPQKAHSILLPHDMNRNVTKSNLHSRREDLDSAFWRKKIQRICRHILILPALGKNPFLYFWH
jgi:hypothetical protein